MNQGITVMTVPDIRWLRCDIKTLNLLPNILAKQTAIDQGVDDVIFHREGTVTESSSSNVFAVRDGVIYTHPANNLILHGITRLVIQELTEELNIPFIEKALQLNELLTADEVFIASTTTELTPVITIDGAPVHDGQPGPVIRQLQKAFENRIAKKP
jgi:D-alanine transaminase